MRTSKPIAGRHLGWSEGDVRTRPYARFWRPRMAPLAEHVRLALDEGPLAEPLLAPLSHASEMFAGDGVENGFALTADRGMRIAVSTEMPDVTPAMIDWWFGWHSDSPERYKMWHPNAHVHAMWRRPPPAGSRGRARYLGRTSIVDEFIGSGLLRLAISFIHPHELGLSDATLRDDMKATAICAHSTLAGLPIRAGYLVHLVQARPGGSLMRSRFWIGGANVAANNLLAAPIAAIARRELNATEADARALLVHCAQEMSHLASFLPELYDEFKDVN
ncbi:hypothetical protein E5163_02580 [Marinicauda algicola]|uniref:DAPG hydrolase PhiG domain-containing protein n=1 Tax=Marinicauda algicola TaxID=2029849 RepID=A0A4S2H358_9PROT|nr:hypothetical protein [Marinicauda algicola]TGY90035.1 hypothetical protein E5163_02580 [Marinicauda algicola]